MCSIISTRVAEESINRNVRLVAYPTLENLRDNWAARIVRIGQVQPVRKSDAPAPVVNFIHELTIFSRDTKCGHGYAAFFACRMQWFRVSGTCGNRCEICLRRIWWARWRMRRRESLVQTLKYSIINNKLSSMATGHVPGVIVRSRIAQNRFHTNV